MSLFLLNKKKSTSKKLQAVKSEQKSRYAGVSNWAVFCYDTVEMRCDVRLCLIKKVLISLERERGKRERENEAWGKERVQRRGFGSEYREATAV